MGCKDSENTINEVKQSSIKLKNKIKELRKQRNKSYFYYSRGEELVKIINSFFNGLLIIGMLLDFTQKAQNIIIIFTIVTSWSMWSNLSKKAANNLSASNDLKIAEDLLNTYTKRINELSKKNILSEDQETQMTNMIVNIDVQLESLSTCNRIFNILIGISNDKDVKDICGNFLELTKKYNI